MADGSLLYQYNNMPAVSGSWSHESIGFEDRTGNKGVQILYGESPPSFTAYVFDAVCFAYTCRRLINRTMIALYIHAGD